MQNTLKYNTTQNICKAKQNTTLQCNGWVSTAAVLFLFHPSTSPDFSLILIFTRGRRWSKVAKRKNWNVKLHGIWDLLTGQEGTSQVHLNVNHNAREGRGCKWTKLGVLFTLEHFWLTSQPFWQVTIGFPRWQEASSRPSLLPPFLKLYKVIRYNTIRYNTILYNTIRYNGSSFYQVKQYNTILPPFLKLSGRASLVRSISVGEFPIKPIRIPKLLVTVRCVLPMT